MPPTLFATPSGLSRQLNIHDSCGADFDRGEASCPGTDGAVYVTPANGALITPPNQCSVKYEKNPMRIDTGQ
jgi:hypothetical protein